MPLKTKETEFIQFLLFCGRTSLPATTRKLILHVGRGFEGASPNNSIVNVYNISYYFCLEATSPNFRLLITHQDSSYLILPQYKTTPTWELFYIVDAQGFEPWTPSV